MPTGCRSTLARYGSSPPAGPRQLGSRFSGPPPSPARDYCPLREGPIPLLGALAGCRNERMTEISLALSSPPLPPVRASSGFSLAIAPGSTQARFTLQGQPPSWLHHENGQAGSVMVIGTPPRGTGRPCHLQITAVNSTGATTWPPSSQRRIPATGRPLGRVPGGYVPSTGPARTMTAPIPLTVNIRESMPGVLRVVITAPLGRQIAFQGIWPPGVAYLPGPSSMLTLTVHTQR